MAPGSLRTLPSRIQPRLPELTLNGAWRGGSGREQDSHTEAEEELLPL